MKSTYTIPTELAFTIVLMERVKNMYLLLYFRQPVCTDGIQAGTGAPVVPVQHQSDCKDTTAYEINTDRIQHVCGRGFLVWDEAQKFLKWRVKNCSCLPKLRHLHFTFLIFFIDVIAHMFNNRLYAQYCTVIVCKKPPNILQQYFPTFLTPHTTWATSLILWTSLFATVPFRNKEFLYIWTKIVFGNGMGTNYQVLFHG